MILSLSFSLPDTALATSSFKGLDILRLPPKLSASFRVLNTSSHVYEKDWAGIPGYSTDLSSKLMLDLKSEMFQTNGSFFTGGTDTAIPFNHLSE